MSSRVVFFGFLLFSLAFTFSVSEVEAQVVINEFSSADSSDWVEIFNTSPSEVNLSSWMIKDTTSSIYEFSGGLIPAGSTCFQSVSNRLNNDGDRIELFNSSTQTDCVSYGDGNGSFCGSGADVAAPSSGQTVSRVPDGTGGWTLGSSTMSSVSCESLVPTPTPTPSSTPNPTAAATPTPSSTPTSTPIPTKKPTPKPTPTPKPEVLGDESDNGGLDFSSSQNTPSVIPTPSADDSSANKFPILAVVLILLGMGLVGFSIFSFIRRMKKGYTSGSENTPTQIT